MLFLAVMIFMTVGSVFAQADISSPYSRFGLGTMSKNKSNTMIQSMGGISNALDGKYLLNNANPASYAEIDSLTFLFDAGFYMKFVTYRTSELSERGSDASFDYFDLGFGVTKWWKMGVGAAPFSDREYTSTADFVWEYEYPYVIDYDGVGGLNKIYWTNGFKVFKNLSLGVKMNYIFGNITDLTTLYFPDHIHVFNEKRTINLSLSDLTFDFGLIFKHDFKKDYRMAIGLTYSLPATMKAHRNIFIKTMFKGYGDNSGNIIDTILYKDGERVDVKYPQSIGAGITLQKGESWLIGVDFNWSNWAAFRMGGVNDSLQNSWNVAVGASYTPDHTSVSSYLRKVNYRAGFHYDQTFYNIYGTSIKKYGLTFGVGLPIQRAMTTLNIAAEIGRMGTTQNNLIAETYFNISFGVSIHDRWFVKRRYK